MPWNTWWQHGFFVKSLRSGPVDQVGTWGHVKGTVTETGPAHQIQFQWSTPHQTKGTAFCRIQDGSINVENFAEMLGRIPMRVVRSVVGRDKGGSVTGAVPTTPRRRFQQGFRSHHANSGSLESHLIPIPHGHVIKAIRSLDDIGGIAPSTGQLGRVVRVGNCRHQMTRWRFGMLPRGSKIIRYHQACRDGPTVGIVRTGTVVVFVSGIFRVRQCHNGTIGKDHRRIQKLVACKHWRIRIACHVVGYTAGSRDIKQVRSCRYVSTRWPLNHMNGIVVLLVAFVTDAILDSKGSGRNVWKVTNMEFLSRANKNVNTYSSN